MAGPPSSFGFIKSRVGCKNLHGKQASQVIRMLLVLPLPHCTKRPREGRGTGLWGEGPMGTGSESGSFHPGHEPLLPSGIGAPLGATPPRLLGQEVSGP